MDKIKTVSEKADEIIAIMQDAGLTPDEMIEVLRRVRMKINNNQQSK